MTAAVRVGVFQVIVENDEAVLRNNLDKGVAVAHGIEVFAVGVSVSGAALRLILDGPEKAVPLSDGNSIPYPWELVEGFF